MAIIPEFLRVGACRVALLLPLLGLPVGLLAEEEVAEMSGLTIVGAKETPQSLILVPWKDSNVDATTEFGSLVDSVEIEPVDRVSLDRRLLFDDLVRADLRRAREEREAAAGEEETE